MSGVTGRARWLRPVFAEGIEAIGLKDMAELVNEQ